MQKKQITYSPLLGGTCEGIRKPPLISSAKKGTFLEQVPIVSVNRAKGSLFVCSLRSLPLPPISFAHLTHEPPNLASHWSNHEHPQEKVTYIPTSSCHEQGPPSERPFWLSSATCDPRPPISDNTESRFYSQNTRKTPVPTLGSYFWGTRQGRFPFMHLATAEPFPPCFLENNLSP